MGLPTCLPGYCNCCYVLPDSYLPKRYLPTTLPPWDHGRTLQTVPTFTRFPPLPPYYWLLTNLADCYYLPFNCSCQAWQLLLIGQTLPPWRSTIPRWTGTNKATKRKQEDEPHWFPDMVWDMIRQTNDKRTIGCFGWDCCIFVSGSTQTLLFSPTLTVVSLAQAW